MKVVVAMDSFKGSLSSVEAGEAVAEGVRRVFGEQAAVVVKPLADGGEGTARALVGGGRGWLETVQVSGPLLEPVLCHYGKLRKNGTAVVETAQAAGLCLVGERERNPLYTTTKGVGEMIRHAIEGGSRKFIIGIGGSATNDCGIGMLDALGFRFLDFEGRRVKPNGKGLEQIKAIDGSGAMPELQGCIFHVASDVKNPLLGPRGASRVYGPQKGADDLTVERLERGAENFAKVASVYCGKEWSDFPGAGAAGGLGFAFLTFLNSELNSGFELVMRETGLESDLKGADVVVTGEGRLDGQTAMGKAPAGLAEAAKKYGAVVIALAGEVADSWSHVTNSGIDAVFPIERGPSSPEMAMDKDNAVKNLSDTAEQIFKLIEAVKQRE